MESSILENLFINCFVLAYGSKFFAEAQEMGVNLFPLGTMATLDRPSKP